MSLLRRPQFWLLNLALLLLYGWTLTEEATIQVQVAEGSCTAVFTEGRHFTRTSTIPCPDLAGGFVGLYFRETPAAGLDWGPLEWLAPRSGWRSVTFSEAIKAGRRLRVQLPAEIPGWRHVWGEWRPVEETAVLTWPTPLYGDYTVTARLRRPAEPAGLVLLQPDGETGRAFITTPDRRRGVWWGWQGDAPTEPLVGMPFQKPLLAQIQSLLRRILRAHHAALLLLLAGWLLARPLRRLSWPTLPRLPAKLTVAGLALVALAAAILIATMVLERIPHVQDSVTYLFQAQLLARGHLWAPAPPLPEYFAQEFMIVENGRWFGQYAPGFPAALALGVLAGAPWLVNPILAAGAIPLLYLLGRRLFDSKTGLLAAALALISPFFLFLSGSFMSHPAELFWMTLFMLAWLQALAPARKRRWGLVAGIAFGLLFLTRQQAAVSAGAAFAAVTGAAALWRLRGKWRPLLVNAGLATAVALPLAALLFVHQGIITGHPFRDPRLLTRPFDRPGFGPDAGEPFNAFNLTMTDDGIVAVDWYTDPDRPPRGHTPARGVYNVEQNWRALETDLFGWLPIFTFSFLWLGLLLKRPSWQVGALLAMIGGIMVVITIYWANGIMYGPRYFYGALPAFLLLTAHGMETLASRLGSRAGRGAVVLLVGILLLGTAVTLSERVDAYRGFNFVSREPRAKVEAEISGRALVFVTNEPANWWEYGRFFSGNTPWLDGRIIYARDLGDAANRRLMPYFPDHEPYRWQEGQLVPLAELRGLRIRDQE